MPKCTINGREIEVPAGTTIIEAFQKIDEPICHYCWHPGLSVAGVCRLCMVEIENQPRLQIACNTVVQDGMVISSTTEKVKEAVRWGLDFHLINHPLDCPICDQAGECGLQDQYMQFGKYDPEMAEPKVKKHKVVDLGSKIVLDTERCILCSRCVRFTSEVSKTNELGIFNRGDRSEIGTSAGKPLENNYALNTVDICPVGALTSKDFRFRQRVWYLKEHETICTGCSTGCSVKVYYNEEGLFRVKPVYNPEVNGYWMCDEGRGTYKFVNPSVRLLKAKESLGSGQWADQSIIVALKNLGEALNRTVKEKGAERVALVLTGQQSNEEYDAILGYFAGHLGSKQVYHWVNRPDRFDDFDGLLLRGDRNPNTKGLLERLDQLSLDLTWEDFVQKLKAKAFELVVVVGPENQGVFDDIPEVIDLVKGAPQVAWLAAGQNSAYDRFSAGSLLIPLKTFFERDGHYVNYQGRVQFVRRGPPLVASAVCLEEAVQGLTGQLTEEQLPRVRLELKRNHFTEKQGAL